MTVPSERPAPVPRQDCNIGLSFCVGFLKLLLFISVGMTDCDYLSMIPYPSEVQKAGGGSCKLTPVLWAHRGCLLSGTSHLKRGSASEEWGTERLLTTNHAPGAVELLPMPCLLFIDCSNPMKSVLLSPFYGWRK